MRALTDAAHHVIAATPITRCITLLLNSYRSGAENSTTSPRRTWLPSPRS
ncbi:hypothetical protein ABZV31_35230 [Streptomyces sp. NPDC005202]